MISPQHSISCTNKKMYLILKNWDFAAYLSVFACHSSVPASAAQAAAGPRCSEPWMPTANAHGQGAKPRLQLQAGEGRSVRGDSCLGRPQSTTQRHKLSTVTRHTLKVLLPWFKGFSGHLLLSFNISGLVMDVFQGLGKGAGMSARLGTGQAPSFWSSPEPSPCITVCLRLEASLSSAEPTWPALEC